MEPVVTSAEMRECDRIAIEEMNVPGLILMENAGRGVAESIVQHFGSVRDTAILILCGKGNNGGDGFVAARHLLNKGANVTVALLCRAKELKGDARVNILTLFKIKAFKPKIKTLSVVETVSLAGLKRLPPADIMVDAIFGTGFKGAVRGFLFDVIQWINGQGAFKVSIDIPSGVNADTGDVVNTAVRADKTITMGLKKIGITIGEGRSYAGMVEVADIGIPQPFLQARKYRSRIVGTDDVRAAMPGRPLDAHKHSVGKILVLAGSRGYTGAAAMTASTAMLAGAGAVILGTPLSIYPILAKKLTEVMVEPLQETSEGSLSLEALEKIKEHLQWSEQLIIGPGLSRHPETSELIHRIVADYSKSILIDADGLNAFIGDIHRIRRSRSTHIIITPHTGELSRLIAVPSAEIEKNRVMIASETAKNNKLTVILKGAPTIIGTSSGSVHVNSTGNPGMATAGAGDVLAGIVGGLWAQGMEDETAAYCGAFIHGLAGDIAADKVGQKSLLALDIQRSIPAAIKRVEARG